jgi:hypothetical protein
LKNSRQEKLANASGTEEVQQCLMKKCKLCDQKFSRNSDFEITWLNNMMQRRTLNVNFVGKPS